MSVRVATLNDVPTLLALVERFVGDSEYGMKFDRQKASDYLARVICHPEAAAFVSDDGMAGAIVTISDDWCVQPVCYVEKMFVMPEARGTGVSRCIVAAAVEFARQYHCSHCFATATAGLGETVGRLYTNLFRKFEFSECGPVLCRSL